MLEIERHLICCCMCSLVMNFYSYDFLMTLVLINTYPSANNGKSNLRKGNHVIPWRDPKIILLSLCSNFFIRYVHLCICG